LTNRLLIEQTPSTATIFLDAPFATLFERCMAQESTGAEVSKPSLPVLGRPLLAERAAAEARFLARQPLYRRLAHHSINSGPLTTDQTLEAVLKCLNTASPRPRDVSQ
jgi:shikimate kinase